MPIEKHTINIIFFPILYFFFLNKNSESKIAMSIIVIAHTIIYLYFEFVNYAVITNDLERNTVQELSFLVMNFFQIFFYAKNVSIIITPL